jgi:outer membrane protein assembly factor BamE (lipoprotein component of BamABCDE complex)
MISLKEVDRLAVVAIGAAALGISLGFITQNANAEVRNLGSFQVHGSTHTLNDDVFQTIQPGMSAAEVLAKLGEPYAKTRFPRLKTTAWNYHYRDTWNYEADFSVAVNDADVVVSKVSIRTGQ